MKGGIEGRGGRGNCGQYTEWVKNKEKNWKLCFKCLLMGNPLRNIEDSGAKCDLNCGCLDQEISEEILLMSG